MARSYCSLPRRSARNRVCLFPKRTFSETKIAVDETEKERVEKYDIHVKQIHQRMHE